jgi:hypothetical protein
MEQNNATHYLKLLRPRLCRHLRPCCVYIHKEALWACRAEKERRERSESILLQQLAAAAERAEESRRGGAAAPEEKGGGWRDVATELLRTSLLELRDRLEQRRLTQDR